MISRLLLILCQHLPPATFFTVLTSLVAVLFLSWSFVKAWYGVAIFNRMATINDKDVCLIVTHASPNSSMTVRTTYLRRILTALQRVEATTGALAVRRPNVWLGDFNMVTDTALDELRGTPTGPSAAAMIQAFDDIRQLLGVEDAFRWRNGSAEAYTHGVRRIDRSYASPALFAGTPRLSPPPDGCLPRARLSSDRQTRHGHCVSSREQL